MSEGKPEWLQSPELLELVLDALPVGVWIMDREGRIVHGNPAGQRVWSGARYVGAEQFGEYKGWWRDTGQPIEAGDWAAARAIRNGEASLDEEIEIECFDGTRKIILNSALPIRDAAGGIIGGIIVNVDISERVALEERLRTAAEIDELTNTYSRRRFFELLNEEMERATRYQRPLSLVMFDVDKFKTINDQYGHMAGDQVLKVICEQVLAHIRESEHLARYGGDEFMLLLPETTLHDAAHTAERLRALLAGQSFEGPGAVSCSFGACEYRPGTVAHEFVRRADQALYTAKSQGRNRVVTCHYDHPDTGET